VERAFEHAPIAEVTLARAGAFARAGHRALQTVLRVDREAGCVWLEALPSSVPAAGNALTSRQAHTLAEALAALHAQGVAHGAVDRAHVAIDAAGDAHLRFTATVDTGASADRDRAALANLVNDGA
jgi:serine/threonine-protein kinase